MVVFLIGVLSSLLSFVRCDGPIRSIKSITLYLAFVDETGVMLRPDGGSRTRNLLVRSQTIYPVELRPVVYSIVLQAPRKSDDSLPEND